MTTTHSDRVVRTTVPKPKPKPNPTPRAEDQHRLSRLPDPGATFAGVIMLSLFVVPSGYAFGPSGLQLAVATTLGLLALLTWLCYFLFSRGVSHAVNPVRWAVLVYLAAQVVGIATAYRYPLDDEENRGVFRALVLMLAVTGLSLLLCDGLRSRDGFRRFTGLLLKGGYLTAFVGLLQRTLHINYVQFWSHVPGLHAAFSEEDAAGLLGGRATGTGTHPIEFSVACACLIPVAITHLQFAETRRAVLAQRLGVGLLAVGCLLAVSRAGFIALALAFVLSLGRLNIRARVNALAFAFIVFAFVQFGSHGTLSTLRYRLLNTGSDASSRGRTSDYGPVLDLVARNPWSGIGTGRYNPQQNRFLDNAWLGTLLTGGIIRTVALAVMIFVALYVGAKLRREIADPYLASQAGALGISVLVLAVSAYFFDEFSFLQTNFLMFAAVGALGALYALHKTAKSSRLHVEV